MFPTDMICVQSYRIPILKAARAQSLSFLSSFLLLPAMLYSESNLDPRGDQSLNHWSRYASVRLELERTRFSSGEEIPVQIKVENKGYQTIRIYPYAKPNQTFQFFLTDRQGREIPQDFDPIAWKKRERGSEIVSLQRERVKEIILGPKESFVKVLYLNDFYDLKAKQNYRLSLYFYPGPGDLFTRSENLVSFRIEKERYKKRKSLSYTKEKLELSPEETVYLFLSAEVQRNWPDHLKYLDLKKYITVYSAYASRYAEAENTEREFILEEFSTFLRSMPAGRLTKFRLLNAEALEGLEGNFSRGSGSRYLVRVLGVREERSLLKRYEYRYTLEAQKGGFWKIIHIQAKLIH